MKGTGTANIHRQLQLSANHPLRMGARNLPIKKKLMPYPVNGRTRSLGARRSVRKTRGTREKAPAGESLDQPEPKEDSERRAHRATSRGHGVHHGRKRKIPSVAE